MGSWRSESPRVEAPCGEGPIVPRLFFMRQVVKHALGGSFSEWLTCEDHQPCPDRMRQHFPRSEAAMGAVLSCFHEPSFLSSSECSSYAKARKEAVKGLLSSTQGLSAALRAHSQCLRNAGSSLVLFCASHGQLLGTSIPGEGAMAAGDVQVPSSFPSGPGPEASYSSFSGASGVSGVSPTAPGVPQVVASGEKPLQLQPLPHSGDTSQPSYSQAGAGAPEISALDSQRPAEGAPPAMYPTVNTSLMPQLQPSPDSIAPLAADVEAASGRQSDPLDRHARQLNAGFLEAAALMAPLLAMLEVSTPLDKKATPPFVPQAAVAADGALESLGVTLQKLVNWERKLQDDAEELDKARSRLHRGDRKMSRKARKAARHPQSQKEVEKMQTAQHSVEDISAMVARMSATVASTFTELERGRAEALLPQVLRLVSGFAAMWQTTSAVFAHQQRVAAELASLHSMNMPHGRSSNTAQAAASSSGGMAAASADDSAAGATSGGVGETTKVQHDATKSLGSSFQRLQQACSNLATSQRKFCMSLVHWLAVIKDIPDHFPRPVARPAHPGEDPTQPAVGNKDHVFFSLVGDWMQALARLPDRELAVAVAGFCGALDEARDLQSREVKQAKSVERAEKQLRKAEQSLQVLQHKEHEMELALEASRALPYHELDQDARQNKLRRASKGAAMGRATVDAAREKEDRERQALGQLQCDIRVMEGSALCQGMPAVFQQAATYSASAADGLRLTLTRHASQ